MSTYTPNINLSKPSIDDNVSILELNSNFDKIDTQVHKRAELIRLWKNNLPDSSFGGATINLGAENFDMYAIRTINNTHFIKKGETAIISELSGLHQNGNVKFSQRSFECTTLGTIVCGFGYYKTSDNIRISHPSNDEVKPLEIYGIRYIDDIV